MAKPKSRVETAAIAGMLGVAKASPEPPVATPKGNASPKGGEVERSEGAHPVRDRAESGVARADNALVLDPHRITRRGRYVRPFTDDRRFRELMTAIQEAGGVIHVPVLVRVEGPPGAVEYVLVDGTHRLEAALRLGIRVPAVNLGRIAPDRAYAIQVMANEVRASMHVVDQAAYVRTLLGQGLNREAVQRTTGFSSGRVSELARIGDLLAALSDAERGRARQAAAVTHRALRGLAAAGDEDAFRRGVVALVASAPAEEALDSDGYELSEQHNASSASVKRGSSGDELGARGHEIVVQQPRRGREALEPGGLSFVAGRNARGTSVTFRMAWRARAVREDPQRFLERVHEALQAIAAEATEHYDLALADTRRGGNRRAKSSDRAARRWGDAIARDEAEISGPIDQAAAASREAAAEERESMGAVMPEEANPMPMPPSRRRATGEPPTEVNRRLLAGLSLPMLAERLRRRNPEYQHMESQLADVERRVEETRQRAREVLDAERTSGGRRSTPDSNT
jgi:ParB-like chromosome segregation protein Spo0J